VLLAASDSHDAEAAARLEAFAEGYALALAQAAEQAETAYGEGYARCASDVKAAEHAIYDQLARAADAERGRWVVRGEVRTRATFADPHPADYQGGPVAWASGWTPGSGTPPPELGSVAA
jgi:hypothetical protein